MIIIIMIIPTCKYNDNIKYNKYNTSHSNNDVIARSRGGQHEEGRQVDQDGDGEGAEADREGGRVARRSAVWQVALWPVCPSGCSQPLHPAHRRPQIPSLPIPPLVETNELPRMPLRTMQH